MVLVGETGSVMIDCVSSPIVRLDKAGVDFQSLTDLVLTHFHPDHVSGVPLLLMDMWLLGRKSPLAVRGLSHTLERIQGLMDFYGWSKWPGFFPVQFVPVKEEESVVILDSPDVRLLSSPVHHLVPTIGLRLEFKRSSKVLAYSGDTEPCREVQNLAAGADVLIHEAAGEGRGHSSAAQAAQVAAPECSKTTTNPLSDRGRLTAICGEARGTSKRSASPRTSWF
jgi:ribonuclease Z